MTQIKTAFGCIVCLALFGAILAVAVEPYKCLPYVPKYGDCDLSRYQVNLHDITEPGRKIIATIEGLCIVVAGNGSSKRYIMHDVIFNSANREDIFDKIEVPASQATVCEVK